MSQWRKDPDGRVLSILIQYNSFVITLCVSMLPPPVSLIGKFSLRPYMSIVFPLMQLFSPVILSLTNSVAISLLPNICLISDLNLTDAWRKLHPRSREYSWFNSDLHLHRVWRSSFFRLKCYLLFGPVKLPRLFFCVNLCLGFDQAQVRGPGLWKFNASLSKDNEFCAQFH